MRTIRKIYLYLFSLVGLVLVVIGCVELVNLGLKTYIFTAVDQYYAYPAPRAIAPPGKADMAVPAGPSEEELAAYNAEQLAAQRQGTAAWALAMIIVGLPLYLYHWNIVRKDKDSA